MSQNTDKFADTKVGAPLGHEFTHTDNSSRNSDARASPGLGAAGKPELGPRITMAYSFLFAVTITDNIFLAKFP